MSTAAGARPPPTRRRAGGAAAGATALFAAAFAALAARERRARARAGARVDARRSLRARMEQTKTRRQGLAASASSSCTSFSRLHASTPRPTSNGRLPLPVAPGAAAGACLCLLLLALLAPAQAASVGGAQALATSVVAGQPSAEARGACDDFYACNHLAAEPCRYPPEPAGVDCDGVPLVESGAGPLDANAYGALNLTGIPAYSLASRPRRCALVLVDAQEEYRAVLPRAALDNMVRLARAAAAAPGGGIPVVRSAWARRWTGPHGRPEWTNANDRLLGMPPRRSVAYAWKTDGELPLAELAAVDHGDAPLLQMPSESMDLFWNGDYQHAYGRGRQRAGGGGEDGGRQRHGDPSVLASFLGEHGVDTVFVAGMWTDACVLSTAISAHNRGFDVVVVGDATATGTGHGDAALAAAGAYALVRRTDEVEAYLREHKERPALLGEYRDPAQHDGRVRYRDEGEGKGEVAML